MKMKKEFEIYARGLIYMSVCTNIADEKEIERMANLENPTGIKSKWRIDSEGKFRTGESNPHPCEKKPETHYHYLLSC